MRPFVLHQCDEPSFDTNRRWGTISTYMFEIQPAEPVSFKKESTIVWTSLAVVVAERVLLSKNSFFIILSFSYRAKAIKWLSRAMSADSVSFMLAWNVLWLILEQTRWHLLAAMSSIHR